MRSVCVTYIHGASGVGKTRGIYKHFPAESICRITSYSKNGVKFDSYFGHEVLVFEEFASQIPIEEMLNYLDVYPLIGAVLKRELSYILDGSPTYSRSIKRKATKYNYDYRIWHDYAGDYKHK